MGLMPKTIYYNQMNDGQKPILEVAFQVVEWALAYFSYTYGMSTPKHIRYGYNV